jgi:hypothetical protein
MHIPDDGQGDVRRFDLAIDVVFPDPPGDELVVLGTEIDDEDQAETPFKSGYFRLLYFALIF